MSPLNAAICTTMSYTLWVEWYYIKTNYLTLRWKVKVSRRPWYLTSRSNNWFLIVFSCPGHNIFVFRDRSMIIGMWVHDHKVVCRVLTLRWKVKVSRRSLRYATHRLMVVHPHTNYHWPISRQKCYGPNKKILFKKQLFDLEVKDQRPTKVITVRDTPPYGHAHTNYLSMNKTVHGQIDRICVTIRRCVTYRNDLCGTLTFDLKVK
jgi:hypothetical protein